MINYLSFAGPAHVKGLTLPRPDIVISQTTPPLIATLGCLIKQWKRSRFIFWLQDIYPDVAISLGKLKVPLAETILTQIANHIYRRADAIVTIGEYTQRTLIEKGVPPERIRVIHNWSDGRQIYPLAKSENPFVSRHQLENQFLVSYSGNLGLGHELTAVQGAMVHFRGQPKFTWVFIGDGAAKSGLQRYVQRTNIRNVRFLPYQPYEDLLYSLNACDVSLVLLRDELAGQIVPCKVYSALAVGKPVIAICPKQSELNDIIHEAQCGFAIPNHDQQKLIDVLCLLKENTPLRRELGENGRRYFMAHFDYQLAMERYTAMLRELID